MARASLIAVLCLAVFAQVALGQYSNTAKGTALSQKGSLNEAGDRLVLTNFTLREMKGAWKQIGLANPVAQVQAEENSEMPNCSNEDIVPDYEGLDFDAGRYYVLAGINTTVNAIAINQQRSLFLANASYAYPVITTASATGAVSCTGFQPYIDVGTGELRAESLAISIWERNTTTGATRPIRTRPSCTITGRERPGCYTGEISMTNTNRPANGASMAPSVAISSIPGIAPQTARPANSIVTISKNTWVCEQGECLRLSPKHSKTSPVYGCA